MAGYIGTKAVTLSTTAANVTGDAEIKGNLTVQGTTITVDSAAAQEIVLGDNDKMTFGAGSDLQIYHDGSNSYIDEQGTGNLNIGANSLNLFNTGYGKQYAAFVNGAGATLYYNGSAKLSTTSTGVDVTGTVTADGLTVQGVIPLALIEGSTHARLHLKDSGAAADLKTIELFTVNGRLEVNAPTDDLATAKNRIRLDNNGDISFYEDTGTTAKLFWDASAEALGLGTSSPSAVLTTQSTGALTTDSNDGDHSAFGLLVYQPSDRAIDTVSAAIGFASLSGRKYAAIGAQTYSDLDQTGLNFYVQTSASGSGAVLTEAMRIDASGNLLVGKTTTSFGTQGIALRPVDGASFTRSNGSVIDINRLSTDGSLVGFYKDGTTVGSIGTVSGALYIFSPYGSDAGIRIGNNSVLPCNSTGGERDNATDLGTITARYDDIYATNGTIQTSDANEKQQIAELTAAEMQAAKAISKLFKTFKWNDSVAEKGDDARIHSGVIAQEVEAAMTDAGLDAGRYAFFISSTWWESTEVIPAVEEVLDEEGNVVTEAQPERTVTHTHETAEEAPEGAVERTRKGIRYPQLLSFIGAATEQRLVSIEARLDALEAN